MLLKTYIITYTSEDKYEMAKGVTIITNTSRNHAIKQFKKEIGDKKLVSIDQIKNKPGIVFNQNPVIE